MNLLIYMFIVEDINKSVSDIVRGDYRTAEVFRRHGINYCCSGQYSLLEACALKELDYNRVVAELDAATRTNQVSNNLQFHKWKLSFLTDYIINVHHAYLDLTLPELERALISIIDGHSKKHPELNEILDNFLGLSVILKAHNSHEEEIIFPYIRQIEHAWLNRETYGNLFVRTLRKPLSNIEKEHAAIGELLNRIRQVSYNYTAPSQACTNHQVIYHKLKEFHNDMVQHKFLENNILFPRAIEMEKALLDV